MSSSQGSTKDPYINAELLSLTYGSLIVRLIKDYEKPEEINEQLEKMGYNIGIRIIDDYLSRNIYQPTPNTFKDVMEKIKLAIRYYLNVNASFSTYSNDEYIISFSDNPLNDLVELPEKYKGLNYSNILCGVIRGALESINIKVECYYEKDTLKGNDTNEIKVKFIEVIEEKNAEEEI